jgi:hypothetical protein
MAAAELPAKALKPFEVYWTDHEKSARGATFAHELQALGFIMGLRKDARNKDIGGFNRAAGQPFNCDEFGVAIEPAEQA